MSEIFCRQGCYKKDSKGLSGTNKAGTVFFGIDSKYLVSVQKKEIFELIGHGFDYVSLISMPIEERRYYYHLLVEKHSKNSPENRAPSKTKPKETVKFNPIR